MRVRFKVFQGDSTLHTVLNLLLLPFMVVASVIALVVYLSLMFITILVIQFAGCLLGIFSLLKWGYETTMRWIANEPLPARR